MPLCAQLHARRIHSFGLAKLNLETLEDRLPLGNLLTGGFLVEAVLDLITNVGDSSSTVLDDTLGFDQRATRRAVSVFVQSSQESVRHSSLIVTALDSQEHSGNKTGPAVREVFGASSESSNGSLSIQNPLSGATLDSFRGRKGPNQSFTIGPNVRANSRDVCPDGRGFNQNEIGLAASAAAIVIAYKDSRGLHCPNQAPGYQRVGWAFSLDGGKTFTDGGPLPGRTQWLSDPNVAVSPDGKTFYLIGLYNGLNSVAVTRGAVTEKTIAWSNPTVISQNGPFDKEAIAVDPHSGAVYVTYTRVGTGIYSATSTDEGVSFSIPVPVGSGGQGSAPIVGPNGELYVAWTRGGEIVFAKSLDGGVTFSPVQGIARTTGADISGTERSPTFPSLAVDLSPDSPNFGNIYAAFQTSHLSGKPDVVLIRSTDGGASWSSPILMNDDGGIAPQWFPTISVDASGNVNAFFYDRRQNPGTTLTDLFFAQSTDGGLSFNENVKVSEVPSLWQVNSDGMTTTWGDYITSASIGTDALIGYTDGRDGDSDAYFTRVSTG